jgi:hypothetical protein
VGGSSNTQIFRKALFSIMKSDFDFVIIGWTQSWRHDKSFIGDNTDNLLEESYKTILNSENGYTQIIGSSHNSEHCNLEPQATDNVIMYTIVLHELLKLKNIPHLFITMGELDSNTLNNRTGWLDLIDSKNYYGEGNVFEKMNYSITNSFKKMHINEGFSIPNDDIIYNNGVGYIRDNVNHLTTNAKYGLAKAILKYILDNNILKIQ